VNREKGLNGLLGFDILAQILQIFKSAKEMWKLKAFENVRS